MGTVATEDDAHVFVKIVNFADSAEPVDTSNIGDMDSVSGMDEIIPDVEEDSDIPSQEFGEIENELSLENVREDEEREAEKEEAEDEE